MKNLFIGFLVGVILAVGYFFVVNKQASENIIETKVATNQFSINTPPKESLKGRITNLIGDVFWQSRVASSPALIESPQIVSQGEGLETGDNGRLTADFTGVVSINLSSNSDLSIIQTLPNSFVFEQTDGEISFSKQGEIPVSVKALDLLVSLNQGKLTIILDKEKNKVEINGVDGQVKVGYEDSQNVSQVIDIKAGQKFLFDDDSLTSQFL